MLKEKFEIAEKAREEAEKRAQYCKGIESGSLFILYKDLATLVFQYSGMPDPAAAPEVVVVVPATLNSSEIVKQEVKAQLTL